MNQYQDQTAFANQEPVLEDASLPEQPKVAEPENLEENQAEIEAAQKKKKKVVLGLIIAGVISLLLILLLALFVPSQMQQDSGEVDIIVPEGQPRAQTRTERELEVLKDRLDEIDPTREYLTVPPIDYSLRLE